MDPTAALKRMLEKSKAIIERSDTSEVPDTVVLKKIATDAVELAEIVQDLDKWVKNGGHLPRQWSF